MKSYKQYIGRLIDQGKSTLEIQRAILRAHDQGKIDLPIKVWGTADRGVLMVDSQSGESRQAMIDMVNESSPLALLLNPRWAHVLRNALKNPEFSLKSIGKRPKWQTLIIQNFPHSERLFGEGKHQALSELGLSPWSEEQFQKLIVILAKVQRRDIKPCYEYLRLWTNGYTDMDGKYLKRYIPFDFLLCDDTASLAQKQAARRIAESMLRILKNQDQRIGETITASEARSIENALAWIIPVIPNQLPRYLVPLIALTDRFRDLNWEQLTRIITFIKHQKNTSPDPLLLQDFVDGYVDIHGDGIHRANLKE